MFKKSTSLLLIMVMAFSLSFSQSKPGANLTLLGFKFDKRIKGPRHKKSKIIELMIDENGYYLATTYNGPKSYLTLIIYELYTWNIVGTYKFKSRAELYNSYFTDDGKFLYLNTDIYKHKYTEINIKTKELKILGCSETPHGCDYIEPQPYVTSGYTAGENYYIFMDENRKTDLKVYVNKNMIMADSYLEEEEVPEIKEEKKEEVKKPEKIVSTEMKVEITEKDIESIKQGKTVDRNNAKILLNNDTNKKLLLTGDENIRYVLLTLIELSKISFGNTITNNNVKVHLQKQ